MTTIASESEVSTGIAANYSREGFCLGSRIFNDEFLRAVIKAMDDVREERYETGTAPHWRTWKPGDDPEKLCKIDQPQLSNRTIQQLVSSPELGRLAAAVTGADFIQAWAVQLLYKPAGGRDVGNVGWHQDQQYWSNWWEGEVFTAWIAISDVTLDSGPMRFVRGSHNWGLLNAGNFFETNMDALKQKLHSEGRDWNEVAGVLPPGAVSFHHRLTIHGSGPNHSALPRRSFAIHMRTSKSKPVNTGKPEYYTSHLDDPAHAPVIYDQR